LLVELRLENYAVIDHVAVEFAPGLNLLTGETGAGKSILIDALSLLMGQKASADVVRFGAERAVISAVFEVETGSEKKVASILGDNGIDAEEDNLILRREIAAKGRVFVNNQPATVAVLKQLAPHLSSIHAQNESLVAFDSQVRLELLDAFTGSQLHNVRVEGN
jgi:DNA repair protein RecN (Recombination protein N)